jgi:periplasmic protein CpxP/Spy
MNPKNLKLPAFLLAGLLAAPLFVAAQEGPFHGEHGPHGGPFIHELQSLDLTDAQRTTIKGYVDAAHAQGRTSFESLRALHRAFETAAPTSAGYSTVVTQLADAEAAAARERVQMQAALRAQIYAVLTDTQKAKLASDLASLPEPTQRGR